MCAQGRCTISMASQSRYATRVVGNAGNRCGRSLTEGVSPVRTRRSRFVSRLVSRVVSRFGAVAKWLGTGLQNRHTWVQIPSAPPKPMAFRAGAFALTAFFGRNVRGVRCARKNAVSAWPRREPPWVLPHCGYWLLGLWPRFSSRPLALD